MVNSPLTDSPQEQPSVKAELHIRRTRRLRSRSGDMLADIRRRDENLGKGNGIVWKEVDGQILLCVWILIQDSRDVDNEADCL